MKPEFSRRRARPIGDSGLAIRKLHDIQSADAGDASAGCTAASHAPVRMVYVIPSDKGIEALLLYSMKSGRNFIEFADGGELRAGRRLDHRRHRVE